MPAKPKGGQRENSGRLTREEMAELIAAGFSKKTKDKKKVLEQLRAAKAARELAEQQAADAAAQPLPAGNQDAQDAEETPPVVEPRPRPNRAAEFAAAEVDHTIFKNREEHHDDAEFEKETYEGVIKE